MAFVPVPGSRSTVSELPNGLEIVIPAKRHLFVMLFLPFWLGGWAFGEAMAIRQLLRGPSGAHDLFLLFWLGGWTVGGAFVVFSLLWMAAGRERLQVLGDALVLRREVFGIGRAKTYDVTAVSGLRTGPAPSIASSRGFEALGLTGGTIAFDYGSKTIYLGAGIDEAEARTLVATIARRNPALVRTAA